MSYRIIVTGSRDWPDRLAVWDWLDRMVRTYGLDITIIHGDCPTGADRFAHEWADLRGSREERYPADWAAHGKAAGPLRNQQMVALGADMCAAFPLGESRGTRDCMRRAREAGIPVFNLAGVAA